MVAVTTALIHEGVWFLMMIRSLNRESMRGKEVNKRRVGPSNVVVGPRLPASELLGVT